MDNNFQAINGLAAIAAAVGTGKLLAAKPKWARWVASLIVAVAVGGLLGFGEAYFSSYNQQHDPAAVKIALEKEILRLAPALVAVVKQDDPQAWEELMTRAALKITASGGNPSQDDMKELGDELRAMTKNVWHWVSMADAETILALARQDIVVDETLGRETIKMCDSRGAALWNLNDLPPESLKAVQRYMGMMATAYRQGKGRQVPGLPTDDEAGNLFRKAIFQSPSPLSNDDAAYFFSGSNTDPGRQCRVRLQFEKNVMTMPENLTLYRWLYAHSVE
jgi:hypothetical protein